VTTFRAFHSRAGSTPVEKIGGLVQTTQMGRRDWEQEDASGTRESSEDRGQLLVITGWILIVGSLMWVWMVFFTKQSEIGLWIAAAVGGLGYLLQRAGNQAR
jgi:hypothetical protein